MAQSMTANLRNDFSIVIPAKNEEIGLAQLIPSLQEQFPEAELIVVDDGSTDETASIVQKAGAICISHPVSLGNGGAIKTGARTASREIIVFMDADGQHQASDINNLLGLIDSNYDLAVGARSKDGQASALRSIANNIYNKLASMMTGFEILDLTSGFRAVRRDKFLSILYLLPNKFSYPTTSTMAFFRSGYFVGYVPITVNSRQGKSHINMVRDGIRFLIIILKIGALFSPMRLFLPISIGLFLIASIYYIYTFATDGRFTNMGMLLYLSALTVFLIGIVSEQVSALHYKDTSRGVRDQYRRSDKT